jgi:cytosine/adenosine deaminase-related metal-dependent hydrolase
MDVGIHRHSHRRAKEREEGVSAMDGKVDLLIVGGTVVTVDDHNQVWKDGAVAVCGDRIVAVGPTEQLRAKYVAERVIDAEHKLVMPGLVDTYHHAGHGMIKGIYRSGVGWPTTEIYFHNSTPEWWHVEGLLTAMERVKFGVTTGVTILGGTPARADDPIFAERNAEAVQVVGMRALIGVGPPDPFAGRLREPWSGSFYEDGEWVERPFTYEKTIEVSKDVFRRLTGAASGRVHTMFAIPVLCGVNPKHAVRYRHFYTDEDVLTMKHNALEAREIADEYGVLIHTHGGRGVFEWAEENYGAGVLREILGRDVVFAHMNGLTDHDISIMRETDCAAAAVPFGAANTRHGTCPIVKLIQNGVRVAISTDGAAPFHISDLFIDLHRAMFLQWMENHDMSLLPSGRAVRLVTVEAAALLGIEDEIGSLEEGKKADIILVDLNQPHLLPFEDPANMIAWYVRGNDVDTVIVDGVVLMEGRRMVTVDETEVLERAREEIKRSFERVDISPYIEHDPEFWQGWRELVR